MNTNMNKVENYFAVFAWKKNNHSHFKKKVTAMSFISTQDFHLGIKIHLKYTSGPVEIISRPPSGLHHRATRLLPPPPRSPTPRGRTLVLPCTCAAVTPQMDGANRKSRALGLGSLGDDEKPTL